MAMNPLRKPTQMEVRGPLRAIAMRWQVVSILFVLAGAYSLQGEISSTNHPFPGISWFSERRTQPPTRLLVAVINLTDPHVRLRVAPGGPDPDGSGPWQTTLMQPTQIAFREAMDLVVNGDFFSARAIPDAEGTNAPFHTGLWSAVNGPAVTDGNVWATSINPRPCLIVRRDRRATIGMLQYPTHDAWEVVAGNTMLVEAGRALLHTNHVRHPRTAVGLSPKQTNLIILVVEGRKPGIAVGMSYEELATEMIRLGCVQALNLDGGGSSLMAIRQPDSTQLQILNQPSDGRERAVANVLGISVNNSPPLRLPIK